MNVVYILTDYNKTLEFRCSFENNDYFAQKIYLKKICEIFSKK